MKRTPPNKNTNEVFYIHLRYQEDDGKISNHGGVTIAYRMHDNESHIEVAFARCNLIDNFCKHTGRAIALGNLNWDRLYLVKKPEDSGRSAIHNAVLDMVQKKLQEIETAHGRTIQ